MFLGRLYSLLPSFGRNRASQRTTVFSLIPLWSLPFCHNAAEGIGHRHRTRKTTTRASEKKCASTAARIGIYNNNNNNNIIRGISLLSPYVRVCSRTCVCRVHILSCEIPRAPDPDKNTRVSLTRRTR